MASKSKASQKLAPVSRLLCLKWPCLRKVGSFFVCVLLFFAFGTLLPAVRNVILYPVWPNAWRPIGTLEILSIKVFTPNNMLIGSELPVCKNRYPLSRIEPLVEPNINFYPELRTKELKNPEHARFLPAMTNQDKIDAIHLFIVATQAFQKTGIEYFMVEGSLLGTHRHGGMIPWDDDIDITVNVSLWRQVNDALGCIEGYTLKVSSGMHWKFFRNDTSLTSGYPFLDIFFYSENEDKLWAMTSYIMTSLFFTKADVFPLTTAKFEGLEVPVPGRTDSILRTLFDYETCQSSKGHHSTSNSSSSTTTVPCSELSYMYEMYHLLK
ncbi:hypothetical protein Bpfe_017542 [Biomphalaria pfeifferi]|uniref:LicD/FKTN/FKRP nucleotidyltransferase domain-containing protein n=1 Tax=Biomphalaria pfeifferi TaxID=112525 RepID=A0AAD8F6A9_BIOPF|nr:hypothetical protein Bpfe_017542 [Biomphalaria pfeifferi]